MRRVTLNVPEGQGSAVADLAINSGIQQVSIYQVRTVRKAAQGTVQDVVEITSSTPHIRGFIQSLVTAPFYEPATYSFAIVHPRAIAAQEGPERETRPFVVPALEIYEDLWQFSHVTLSLAGRVFLAAVLLAYGMIEMNLAMMIAGLLFLPYHHHMLAISFGLGTRKWHLALKGFLALSTSTFLIVAAGAAVAWLSEPPLRFEQFGTLVTSFAIGAVVGIAAALASADDAGRRELIGLAATAHITVLPAWFGIALVFGSIDMASARERFLGFAVAIGSLLAASWVTFVSIGIEGSSLRALPGTGGTRERPLAGG